MKVPNWLTKLPTLTLITVIACAALPPSTAVAAPQKLAVVDLQRVLLSTKAGKAARARFEAIRKEKTKKLKRRGADLKKKEKSLMQERIALEKQLAQKGLAGLTPQVRKRADAFQASLKNFQRDVLSYQKTEREMVKNLARKEGELLKPIESKIKNVIQSIARKGGYSMVLSRLAVVYHSGAHDITALVTKRMNGK